MHYGFIFRSAEYPQAFWSQQELCVHNTTENNGLGSI